MTILTAIIIVFAIIATALLSAAFTHLLDPSRRLDKAAARKNRRIEEVPEAGYFTRRKVANVSVDEALTGLGEEAKLIPHEHVRNLRKELRKK